MKPIVFASLALGLAVLGGCAGLPPVDVLRRGVYDGVGEGYRGPIRVRVETGAGGSILGITITDHREDPLVGGLALEELQEAVLSSGSTNVDGISGATESGAGFLAAVEDALSRAK
jgi:uncharacterized protein with FMN-binding domain